MILASVMNCTEKKQGGRQNDDDDEYSEKDRLLHNQKQQHNKNPFNIPKVAFLLLIIIVALLQVKHQRKKLNLSNESTFPLLSMNEQYLRGQLSPSSNERVSTIQDGGSISNGSTIVHHAYFPTYLQHLSNLTMPYNPTIEVPYFWDPHFSGESVAEHVFSSCHGLRMACEFGLRQPDYNEEVSFCLVVDDVVIGLLLCGIISY